MKKILYYISLTLGATGLFLFIFKIYIIQTCFFIVVHQLSKCLVVLYFILGMRIKFYTIHFNFFYLCSAVKVIYFVSVPSFKFIWVFSII